MHRFGNFGASKKHQVRLELICKKSNKPVLAIMSNTVTLCMWLKAQNSDPRSCFHYAEIFGDLPRWPFKARQSLGLDYSVGIIRPVIWTE